jgi:hypothetical protein
LSGGSTRDDAGLDVALDSMFDHHLTCKLGSIAKRLEELHRIGIDLKAGTEKRTE